ncbi:DNA repair protein rhp7 [Grifola frondosa]|uniref:DNA repair protein rhp7 n=1 Tax=Grifola frondosa TaxID=5627 RepID=A0A1C7MG17_GRIFR|nr:DNA repair protein rhp7 [Grifola frondosa]
MSRRNNIRGPTSALTEFLRESGITPTTVARRARTQQVDQPQPVAGPSNVQEDENSGREPAANAEEYASDNLDEDDEDVPTTKKRKISKAAEAKLKAKEKAKKTGKKGGDDDDYEDEDEDAYTALSKMWKGDLPKPPVGSFENCAKCKKQFTVTKYTLAANPPPGFLCHVCAKASGADPFKKPALPRKRKSPAEKRNVTDVLQLISKHIDDVEALGDIGSINMDEIAKAISKNRSLTAQNAPLFYDIENTTLTLYDVTNLAPPALCTLASLNPNLTRLRLDLCGRMDNSVAAAWSTSLPNLKHIELLGPFLVRTEAWQEFFKAHPALEGFLITQSPRFDLECMRALVENCSGLKELRLKAIGKMDDEFLVLIKQLAGKLTYLDLSDPGNPEALSENVLIDMMSAIGGCLAHLDLSGNLNISDGFLFQGIKPYVQRLSSLVLVNTPDLTDAGVAEFFNTWVQACEKPNPGLISLDLSRNDALSSDALLALLHHSGKSLVRLNINGWKSASEVSLKAIAEHGRVLRQLDIGFCREVDDWVVKDIVEKCGALEELKVWACQRITERCPRRRNLNIYGVELA